MIEMSLGEKVKGFLFNPTDAFNAVKAEDLGEAFKYFLILLLIFSILFSIIVGIIGTTMTFPWATPASLPLGITAGGPLAVILFFISAFVGGLIAVIVGSLWLHIWVYLVGGRKGLTQTMKAVMYSCTPTFVIGWIPF
ncbi:MAG TPA: hypothetical protein ENG56_00895, partial [Candidatus Aenigmarchaeota archaeon]|nr:hypothetical protein [Candidatus Aenigmarchaeota archaeon]